MSSLIPRTAKTRPLTILAQDPSILGDDRKPLLTTIDVPAEQLAPGPCGYRVRVVDYDASTGTLYKPMEEPSFGQYLDKFEGANPEDLLNNPQFHQQNVYAIAMRVLGRFEFALGRRVSWGFDTHQLKIVPHAFREANAFYSRDDEALLFGYFARTLRSAKSNAVPASKQADRIYTCLSHDIVAHETTHALLDGIRERYLLPSLPDQAAFHEGFADLVAILSVTSVADLVETMLKTPANAKGTAKLNSQIANERIAVSNRAIESKSLDSLAKEIGPAFPLLSLAEEMGGELTGVRGEALRRSLSIEPSRTALTDTKFAEPHRRGELLVAAVLRAVLHITENRCFRIGIAAEKKPQESGSGEHRQVSRRQLAECLAKSARDLLTICIRALDYVTPVNITFADYLAGLLTADYELVGNDSDYEYRRHIRESFAAYGIGSASDQQDGIWSEARETDWLRLERTDHHAMMSNRDEMFRFLWENRGALGISDEYYTIVTSVTPTVRVGPDGMLLSETVVEYVQSAKLRGRELARRGFRRPPEMPKHAEVNLYGGGTLIFDVRGTLKYHIRSYLDDRERQNERLKYLWERGILKAVEPEEFESLSGLHEERAFDRSNTRNAGELWR